MPLTSLAPALGPRWIESRACRVPWRSLLLAGLIALVASQDSVPPAAAQTAASKNKATDESKKVLMPRHSIVAPLAYKSVLSSWVASGASIVESDGVLLHPAAADRYGLFFNNLPILTDDFEVIFHFRVAGQENAPTSQAFAFWYLYDNILGTYDESKVIKAADWSEGLKEQGLTFFGSLAKFNGFGAVLSMSDPTQKKPVVSVVANDGSRAFEAKEIPTSGAKQILFRNTLNAAQLKIRVTKTSVVGHFKQSPSLSWNECFKLDATEANKLSIKSGGYIGFSAYSGAPAADGSGSSDLVSITKVEMNNFDDTVIGEDMTDVSSKIQDAYREMLTDENRHFLDQKSQTEHLQRLTSMLADHVKQAPKAELKMNQDLNMINERLFAMEQDCKTVIKEMDVLVAKQSEAGAKAPSGKVVDDIIGIRKMLGKDSASHKEKIEMVQKNVLEVKQKTKEANPQALHTIAKQTHVLEKTAEVRGSQMTWMFVILFLCVMAVGFLMYNRMNYYEKKHFI